MSKGVIFQPEFDSRMLTIGNGGSLRRGQMWLDRGLSGSFTANKGTKTVLDNVQWGFQFLYNPSTLSIGFAMDATLYPQGVLPGDDSSGNGSGTVGSSNGSDSSLNLLGPGSSNLTFDLIVDRTYEVWAHGPSTKTSKFDVPKVVNGLDTNLRRGIMVDFEHFNAMMGYTEENPFVVSQPMFLSFGNKQGNFYYGYVTSYNFQVASWTQGLIPNRGGITGIAFQILPLPSQTKTAPTEGGALSGYKFGLRNTEIGAITSNLATADGANDPSTPTTDPLTAAQATAAAGVYGSPAAAEQLLNGYTDPTGGT